MTPVRRTTIRASTFLPHLSLALPLVLVIIFLVLFLAEFPVPKSSVDLQRVSEGPGYEYGSSPSLELANAAISAHAHDYHRVANIAQKKLRITVQHKRERIAVALNSLTNSQLPVGRLRLLRDKRQIVGERLSDIKSGKETVQELLHGGDVQIQHHLAVMNDKPPMELQEISDFLSSWIHTLHDELVQKKHANFEQIWSAYHDLAVKTLYPWDREYLSRMPRRRDDGSIFLSLATYRDENCLNTIRWAYEKARYPDKLFVGLVQQNCHADCKSGILEGGKTEDVEPDQDCYDAFCRTDQGRKICERDQVRKLEIDEPESLGPYAARYFASKLWYGEQWYMQTDAHMTFAKDWDSTSVRMLMAAPTDKPVCFLAIEVLCCRPISSVLARVFLIFLLLSCFMMLFPLGAPLLLR